MDANAERSDDYNRHIQFIICCLEYKQFKDEQAATEAAEAVKKAKKEAALQARREKFQLEKFMFGPSR